MSVRPNRGPAMSLDALARVLAAVARVRIGVVGDFAVDAYWHSDSDGELSLETGLPVQQARAPSYHLGAAANVVANLRALGVAQVHAAGVAGDDPFGRYLRAEIPGLVVGAGPWHTTVFAKPQRAGRELSRIDFGTRNVLGAATEAALLERITDVAGRSDLVILNQQIAGGVATPAVAAHLSSIAAGRLLVDTRSQVAGVRGAMAKLNACEARRRCGRASDPLQPCSAEDGLALLLQLPADLGEPLFLTMGAAGMWVASDGAHEWLPAVEVAGPVDPVGAGDAVTAALAAVLAAGHGPLEAAGVAVLAAAVTVRKLRETGMASPSEIIALARASLAARDL